MKQTQKIVEELQVELAKHSPILTMRDGAIVDGTDCVWCSSSPCPVTFPCELSVKLSAAISRLQELEVDAKRWRQLLCVRHGCSLVNVYGDDGELSCNKCGIDFKRMTPWEIELKFMINGQAAIDASMSSSSNLQETPRGDEPRT